MGTLSTLKFTEFVLFPVNENKIRFNIVAWAPNTRQQQVADDRKTI